VGFNIDHSFRESVKRRHTTPEWNHIYVYWDESQSRGTSSRVVSDRVREKKELVSRYICENTVEKVKES